MKSKLLFIYGPLGGGGAERVLIDFLSNLDKEKYDLDLCLMTEEGILLPEVPAHINIIPLWPTYTNYYKLAFRLSKWGITDYLFKRVLTEKLRSKYDVEISFLEGMPLKLHALMNTNSKKITWVHCDLYNFHYTNHQFKKGEELKAYDKMDRIVCVSNDALKALKKRFPACNTPKEVIYNPVDIARIQKLSTVFVPAKIERFTIVAVGRLTMQKKVDRILRLAARLENEGIFCHFRIVGDGELKTELQELVKELQIEDCIEFVGFVQNPYPYIKHADLMVVSSGFEGFGLVVCEAMCLGTPVVSTKTAGPIEIIDNDKYGLLCEHDDEAIYQAVKKMIQDDSFRTHYEEMGKKRVSDFDVAKALTCFDQVIEKIRQ